MFASDSRARPPIPHVLGTCLSPRWPSRQPRSPGEGPCKTAHREALGDPPAVLAAPVCLREGASPPSGVGTRERHRPDRQPLLRVVPSRRAQPAWLPRRPAGSRWASHPLGARGSFWVLPRQLRRPGWRGGAGHVPLQEVPAPHRGLQPNCGFRKYYSRPFRTVKWKSSRSR